MHVSDRLLAKEALNLKRIVLILSSISLIMYLMMDLMEKINRLNWLPFGWKYQMVIANKTVTGKVPLIAPDALQRHIPEELRKWKKIDSLNFKTFVLSRSDREFQFWLDAPPGTRIFCQGEPGKIFREKHRRRIYLKKGFNEIEIRYSPHKGWPKGLRFILRFYKKSGFVSGKLPYYNYTLPGSSISKSLFYFLRFLDLIKPGGFILSFILLVLLFPVILFQKKQTRKPQAKKQNLAFLIFEYACFGMGLMFSILYLNNHLHLKVSHSFLWAISLSIPALNLISSLSKNIYLGIKIKKILVIFLISVMIFGYIYRISGKMTPLETEPGSDLHRHMDMVYHFQQYKEIKADHNWNLYPQSSHAFLSIISDLFQTDPKIIITPFMAIILILIYFLIFLLTRHFFPESGFFAFFLIMILANFQFIMDNVFRSYFFPPIISIFFFLSALFFFFKERMMPSSVLFAVSLIVYPYFMGIFATIMFFLLLNCLFHSENKMSRKIIGFALFFLLPIVFSGIYAFMYLTSGLRQHQAGFFTFFKLNPFSALRPLNSFGILIGISYLFSRIKKNRTILILVFSTIFGFFIYYVPYYFFNIGSSYYLIKNLTYLIFIGIILEIHALENICLWLKKSRLFQLFKEKRSSH